MALTPHTHHRRYLSARRYVVTRTIAPGLSERLGQQVVVENRAGASTMIGHEIAAKAPPDGYTFVMGISTLAINPATFKKVPYDALRDFAHA